jgi:hypothetical protein
LGQAEREKRLVRTGETDRMWFFSAKTRQEEIFSGLFDRKNVDLMT